MANTHTISPSSLAVQLTLVFRPRQHPSPASDCQNARRQFTLRLVHIILLILLASISFPVIVLRAMSYNFIYSNRDMAFVYHTLDKVTNAQIAIVMAAIPKNIPQSPANLALATSTLAFILSAIHLALILSSKKTNQTPHSPMSPRTTTLLYVLLAFLLLTSVVRLSATHTSSSHFQVSYLDSAASFLSNDTNWGAHDYVRYDIGTFDLETWACELKNVAGAVDAKEDYARQCEIERAARLMLVPLFILLWALVAVQVWAWVKQAGNKGRRDVVEGSKMEEDVEAKAEANHEESKEEQIEATGNDTSSKDEQTDANGHGMAKVEDEDLSKIENGKSPA